MIWFLLIVIIALSAALYVSIKRNLLLMEQLDDVKEQIEESLDVLDYVYGRIAVKAQTEVLSDEPLVRELIADMQSAKDAMIIVANKIVLPFIEEEDEE